MNMLNFLPALSKKVRDPSQAWLIACGLFFVVKLPLCFMAMQTEELRDFDAFWRVSQGQRPYVDFEWQYGPLAPLMYGLFLTIFPKLLITVRFVSLALWTLAVAYLASILRLVLKTPTAVILGALIAGNMLAVPSYSSNHVWAFTAAITCTYYLLLHLENGSPSSLLASFSALVACLLTRPLIAGYALVLGWLTVCWLFVPRQSPKQVARLASIAALAVGLMMAIYGRPLLNGFRFRAGALQPSNNYPNLHFLFPSFTRSSNDWYVDAVRSLRTSLNSGLFYLHFFIWPGVAGTLAWAKREAADSGRFRAAAICAFFALCISLDVLHYGNDRPDLLPIMSFRGQYFLALSFCSIALVIWPANGWRPWRAPSLLSALGLAAMVLFGQLNLASSLLQIYRTGYQSSAFPVLRGVQQSPSPASLGDAVLFVNDICRPGTDTVFIGFYSRGLNHLLRCDEMLEKDQNLLDAPSSAALRAGESPYTSAAPSTVGEVVSQRWAETKPRILLVDAHSEYLGLCSEFLHVRRFGTGEDLVQVCWRD